MAITVTLSSANLGNEADEAFFDAWAAYVAEHVDEACGLHVEEIDQQPYGDAGEDQISGADEEDAETIRRWLSVDGWEAFCASEHPLDPERTAA